jgi:hypothetical protein
LGAAAFVLFGAALVVFGAGAGFVVFGSGFFVALVDAGELDDGFEDFVSSVFFAGALVVAGAEDVVFFSAFGSSSPPPATDPMMIRRMITPAVISTHVRFHHAFLGFFGAGAYPGSVMSSLLG